MGLSMYEHIITINKMDDALNLFGSYDENIKLIEQAFGTSVVCRGEEIKIVGEKDKVDKSVAAVNSLLNMLRKGDSIDSQMVHYVIRIVSEGNEKELTAVNSDVVCISIKGRPIKAKTLGQKGYVDCINKNTVTFGIGPAGTGKTYLAVAAAVKAFKANDVSRIVLTRPAVEAGEKLGFLPGDLQNKVDPYLRPLYDALQDMLGAEAFQKNLEKGTIEVAPLAYMRGRTLDDSFIILDEAQNTTKEQMKMFLTRLGFNSKAIITGDITQIDLPIAKGSGLIDAVKILKNIEGIGIVRLSEKDVVRHRIVQLIVKAYERAYEKNENTNNELRKGK